MSRIQADCRSEFPPSLEAIADRCSRPILRKAGEGGMPNVAVRSLEFGTLSLSNGLPAPPEPDASLR
jgi:hypothetical protein